MASIQIAPSVENSDDWPILEVCVIDPHPFKPRAVTEATQIIGSKPTVRAKLFWISHEYSIFLLSKRTWHHAN
jgi:hypothetical protein